jgi:streptogramin lyase
MLSAQAGIVARQICGRVPGHKVARLQRAGAMLRRKEMQRMLPAIATDTNVACNSALRAFLGGSLLIAPIVTTAQIGTITTFPIPGTGSLGITSGPDGNLWFTEPDDNKIGRMSPTGVVTEFPLPTYPVPTYGTYPVGITSGPDGNLWFTEYAGNRIGRISPAGTITEFPLPQPNRQPSGIALGPDGNLWFAESPCTGSVCVASYVNGEAVGKITPGGVISEFVTTTEATLYYPGMGSIVGGPDGNVWFTEAGTNSIGRITPHGVVTHFPLPMQFVTDYLAAITRGPDGNLWFSEDSPASSPIGKITPAGVVSEFPVPDNDGISGIVSGSDGNLWFIDNNSNLGRITPFGVATEFPLPPGNAARAITSGPDGNIWFVENAGYDPDAKSYVGRTQVSASINATAGFTGNWYNPGQSGHGFSIEVLPGNTMLAEWYVFAPNGGQAWIVATGPLNGTTAVLQGFQSVGPGALFPPNFNAATVTGQAWGTITFTFSDCNSGQVSWQPTAAGYTSGSMPIKRLTTPLGVTCP